MSKARGIGPAPSREISEAFVEFLTGAARLLMWLGVALVAIGAGFLVFTCIKFGGNDAPTDVAQAMTMIGIYDKLLLSGVIALGVGTAYLFWGESVLGALQLMGAALLYFSPFLLATAGVATSHGGTQDKDPIAASLDALSRGGLVLGLISASVLAIDIAIRARTRIQQGSKADQLRYGKGVKEEVDRHNVFLGKCWQLPFCRKFVRERCPIYHARRTCWRELTGCMCEEEVIRNAMENKPIPKDQLMAAAYIPRNMKLSNDQKRERCKSCVIYNEHQKHKYKAWMPAILIGFALIYVLGHGILIQMVNGFIGALDKIIGKATFRGESATHSVTNFNTFQELLLACMFVIMITYSLKVLEYMIFKLKV
jgi:hypothetical protein